MENYIKKVEINCDLGEGFGKWKMVNSQPKKEKEGILTVFVAA